MVTTAIASLCSLVGATQKEEREIGKEGQRRKIAIGGPQEKEKRRSSSISVRRGLFGSPIAIPLGRLIINLLSRFSRHNGAYESNHFLEQRKRIVMTIVPASTSNKTTKVKRLKEGGFCVVCFSIFWVLFCDGSFFFNVFVKPRKFFITKNLIITYKLNIVEVLPQRKKLCHNLGFSWFLS